MTPSFWILLAPPRAALRDLDAGGDLSLESEAGVGTALTVLLPERPQALSDPAVGVEFAEWVE